MQNRLGIKRAQRVARYMLGMGGLCALIIGATGLLAGDAVAHKNATGIVKERMDRFAASRDSLKRITGLLRGEHYAEIAVEADTLAAWAEAMPGYFPAGSDYAPTEAAPSIWTDFIGFQAAAAVMQQAALDVKTAAIATDKATLTAAVQEVAASCKSCHRVYRER